MTCLPVVIWFLVSEQGEPMGQVYRSGEDRVPSAGVRVEHAGKRLEVVEFSELQATCAMRRFRVGVRVLE